MNKLEALENYENMFLKVIRIFQVEITSSKGKRTEYRALIVNKFANSKYFLEAYSIPSLEEELNRESEAIEKDVEEFSQKMRFCLRKGFIKIPEESII